MLLTVRRERKDQTAILGTLLVDGVRECVTMERTAVAIPAGLFQMEITYSPHFGKPMPLIDGVPNRTNIRLHPANWPTQLEGCIAVGLSTDGDDLDNSVAAFNPLFEKILAAIKAGEKTSIQILEIPASI